MENKNVYSNSAINGIHNFLDDGVKNKEGWFWFLVLTVFIYSLIYLFLWVNFNIIDKKISLNDIHLHSYISKVQKHTKIR